MMKLFNIMVNIQNHSIFQINLTTDKALFQEIHFIILDLESLFFYLHSFHLTWEIFGTPSDNIKGIWDWGHLLTTPVNKLYQDHRWFSAMMQISSAFILDFAFFYFHYIGFCMKEILDCLQAVHLNIFKLEYSPNYYWEDPLVQSLVVKYGKYSDFFYSGHVGLLTICALEMRKVGKNFMALLFFICSIFQAFIVISFAIHYPIDVPGGYIFSHYFFDLVCYWEANIDFTLKRTANCFSRTNKTIRINYQNDDKQQPTAI